MPNFSIDITEGMGPSEIKVRPNSMNLTSDPLTGYVKIRTSDGFSQSIPLTQKTGKFTYKYTLEANPATIQIDSFGGSATLNITSIKETYLDDVLLETDENWGYSLSADPGITLDGNTVTVGENVNNYDITSKVKVTQNESGKTIEITIQQLAGEVVGEYEFSASPTSLSFVALGQSKNINVTSMFHYTFNGEWRDDNVPWQVQSITAPFKISGNTVSIGENVNPSVRRGSLVLIQPASRKTITISLSQAAAEITYQYNFSVSPTSLDFAATGGTQAFTITSTKTVTTNGVPVTTSVGYTSSSDTSGITVSGNNVKVTEIEGEGRTGVITFTQKESGKKVYINISQEAKSAVEGWKYYLFSASNGNAINRPTITVEDPIPAEGGNVDLGDWIFAFGIKTVDGVLVIGSDDLDLNGWGNLITDSSNYDKVVRLEQSNLYLSGITRLTLTGIVRNDDRSTLQYYSLTPTFTATENDSSSDRSITLTISLDVYRDARLTYKLTQPNYEAILTFVDGSTIYADTVVFNGLPADNRVIASPKTIPVIVQDINGDTEMKVVLTTAGGTVSAGMADTPDGWKLAETSVYSDTSDNLPNQISNISIQVTREACFPLYDGKFRVSSIRALYSPDFGNPSSELLEKRLAINCQVSGYKLWYRLRIPEYIANLGASEGYYLNRGVLSYGVHCNTQEEKQSWIGDRKPFVPYFEVKTQLDDRSYLTPLPDGHQPGVAFNISGGYCYDEVIPIFMYTYNQIETISSPFNRYLSITYYNPEGSPQYKSIRVSNLIITPNQGQLWTNSGEMNSNNFGSESNPKFTIEVGNGVVWE